jgi:hypothetical protein
LSLHGAAAQENVRLMSVPAKDQFETVLDQAAWVLRPMGGPPVTVPASVLRGNDQPQLAAL